MRALAAHVPAGLAALSLDLGRCPALGAGAALSALAARLPAGLRTLTLSFARRGRSISVHDPT